MSNVQKAHREAAVLLPLGVGFVMASCADMRAALGMGAAVLVSLLLSAITVTALRKWIPEKAHLPIYILIITGYVSIVQMLMEAWFPGVVNMLGVHLAALSVSAVPYRNVEHLCCGETAAPTLDLAIRTAVETGLLLTVLMVVCAVIREIFGSASFFGIAIPALQGIRIPALSGPFGGYLVVAFVWAAIRKIFKKDKEEAAEE